MATKLYDLAVKTGSYTDQQGQEKGRYENIGSMMQGDNGPFLILKRTFNPAGVTNPEDKDSVIVSCFEHENKQQGGFQQQTQQQQFQQAPQQQLQQQQGGYANQQQQNPAHFNQGGFQQGR